MKRITERMNYIFNSIKTIRELKFYTFLIIFALSGNCCLAKKANKTFLQKGKPISTDLFGVFFEDINYSADGGLYAELIQNRSFEYSPSDKNGWNPFTSWEFVKDGYGIGTISVETSLPVRAQNPHYVTLSVEKGGDGVGLRNSGYDGISIKAGNNYDFSVFARQVTGNSAPLEIKLVSKKGIVYSRTLIPELTGEWKKYTATLTSDSTDAEALLMVVSKSQGVFNLDMISLFPANTFHNRVNGLRVDLAEAIGNLKPKFMRFPGGCLVHGDGLNNLYQWKNTIGPVEQRVAQPNIWGYQQSVGLGYFEYFQFCEDIGAKPLPVVAAGVSCQNSGGSWRVGGTGQRAIPLEKMDQYTQDILDLIEYANGPVTSTWGAKRAESGHPESFHLEYIGIGNEDKQTPEFRERFSLIYKAVRKKYPNIKVIGTVGPSPDGTDFQLGWKFANELNIPLVDEHYYMNPGWFITNQNRYDLYKRTGSKVYIGEYASKGNTCINAISEAVFMTSVERNGDVVGLASYAPLLAKEGYTQWNPDLIYFNNTGINLTINYYVQQLFSVNQGDTYYEKIVTFQHSTSPTCLTDLTQAASCVKDSKTGDIILKLVNAGNEKKTMAIDLSSFGVFKPNALCFLLNGKSDALNNFGDPQNIKPVITNLKVNKKFSFVTLPLSLTIIRIKTVR